MRSQNFSRLCLVTAVDIEFKTASNLLADKRCMRQSGIEICSGKYGDRNVNVLKAEIGAIGFPEKLANHLDSRRPDGLYDGLIVVGLAGGLDPRLKTGHSVVYRMCHNGRFNLESSKFKEMAPPREEIASIQCESEITGLVFETLRKSGLDSDIGIGLTVDRIITEAEEKLRLGKRYEAQAADMETYQVLAVCSQRGLPATAVRIISDEALSDLPDFNRAYRPDGSLDMRRMTLSMLARPGASLRFLIGIRPVINALKLNLRAILSA